MAKDIHNIYTGMDAMARLQLAKTLYDARIISISNFESIMKEIASELGMELNH